MLSSESSSGSAGGVGAGGSDFSAARAGGSSAVFTADGGGGGGFAVWTGFGVESGFAGVVTGADPAGGIGRTGVGGMAD